MIHLFSTGGTIFSKRNKDGVALVGSEGAAVFFQYYEAYRSRSALLSLPAGDEMQKSMPYCIPSEELTAKQLNILAGQLCDALEKKECEGIIILHGSDTLAYTAAYLALLFSGAPVPLLLVSANYPPEDERSNGLDNFVGALRFILEKRGTGVYVCNQNKGEGIKIHDGRLILPQQPFSDRLYSLGDRTYGCYESREGRYRANQAFFAKNIVLPGQPQALTDEAAARIHWLRAYPGMHYPPVQEEHCAVLLEGYHSGTIATKAAEGFLNNCRDRNIPVYLCGLLRESTIYESSARYAQLGVVPLCDITALIAYFGLWILASSGENLSLFKTVVL